MVRAWTWCATLRYHRRRDVTKCLGGSPRSNGFRFHFRTVTRCLPNPVYVRVPGVGSEVGYSRLGQLGKHGPHPLFGCGLFHLQAHLIIGQLSPLTWILSSRKGKGKSQRCIPLTPGTLGVSSEQAARKPLMDTNESSRGRVQKRASCTYKGRACNRSRRRIQT